MYDSNNVFQKILCGAIPSKKVYEDESVLAFHDIAPQASTHVLVIPKAPIATFGDLCGKEKEFVGTFFQKVHHVAGVLGVEEGYKVMIHNGAGGGQEVFHVHAHILAD